MISFARQKAWFGVESPAEICSETCSVDGMCVECCVLCSLLSGLVDRSICPDQLNRSVGVKSEFFQIVCRWISERSENPVFLNYRYSVVRELIDLFPRLVGSQIRSCSMKNLEYIYFFFDNNHSG